MTSPLGSFAALRNYRPRRRSLYSKSCIPYPDPVMRRVNGVRHLPASSLYAHPSPWNPANYHHRDKRGKAVARFFPAPAELPGPRNPGTIPHRLLPARTPTGGPPRSAPTHAPELRPRNCLHAPTALPGGPRHAYAAYAATLWRSYGYRGNGYTDIRSRIFRHTTPMPE